MFTVCPVEKVSDNSPNFEEPFEVVDLTESHRDEDESFKERPQHDARVGVVVN